MSMESDLKKKEEIILRNTFVNAQLIMGSEEQTLMVPSVDDSIVPKEKKRSIVWNIPENDKSPNEQAPSKGQNKSKITSIA